MSFKCFVRFFGKCRSRDRAKALSKTGLESRLVSSKHEEFLKDLFARCNFLFFSLFSLSFVVLSGSRLSYDKVSVTLSFEFSVSVIK